MNFKKLIVKNNLFLIQYYFNLNDYKWVNKWYPFSLSNLVWLMDDATTMTILVKDL